MNDEQGEAVVDLFRATGVILLDKRVSDWLKENDPKAYLQLREARNAAITTGLLRVTSWSPGGELAVGVEVGR